VTHVLRVYRLFDRARVLVNVDPSEVVCGCEEVATVRSTRRVDVREIHEGLPYTLHLPPETAGESRIVVGK
jgi:hypothetical protein